MHKSRAAAALVVATGVASFMAAPAQAAGPHASFTFQSRRIEHGAPAGVSYSMSGVTSTEKVLLQRPEGTNKVWTTVKTLPHHHTGNVSVSGLPQGRLPFRIVVKKGTRALFTTASQPLYVYAPVGMATLCRGADVVYVCPLDQGTVQVVDKTFSYIGHSNGFADYQPPDWETDLGFPKTSCRSIHLVYAAEAQSPDATDQLNARVIQGATDAQSTTTTLGNIATLDAKLDGSAFSFQTNSTHGDQIDWTGSADCWSASGHR